MSYSHPTQIQRSKTLHCIEWTGDRIRIPDADARGDTHPMTWASDDGIYIGTGDPMYMMENGKKVVTGYFDSDLEKNWHIYERITGSCVERLGGTPENMTLERINDLPGFTGWGGNGAKPTGMVSVKGVLYYALQNLLGWKPPHFGSHCQHGSDVSIISSCDFGKTWEPDLNPLFDLFHRELLNSSPGKTHWANRSVEWKAPYYERGSYKGWSPMFPGDWFGGPSFVQFGKDNSTAVDDYVYAVSADQFDNGTNLRLGRVKNDSILDAKKWEFATKEEDGFTWTNDLFSSDPVLEIYRHISIPEMVYIESIKKYLLFTWAFHSDFDPNRGSELTVLESDHPWGPFFLVHYDWIWYKEEAGCYCPRLPLKWFDEKSLSGWLEFSGNYLRSRDLPYYAPQVRPFKIIYN